MMMGIGHILRAWLDASDTYVEFDDAPAPGSEEELIAALRRFRDAVTRAPHRPLVRVFRP